MRRTCVRQHIRKTKSGPTVVVRHSRTVSGTNGKQKFFDQDGKKVYYVDNHDNIKNVTLIKNPNWWRDYDAQKKKIILQEVQRAVNKRMRKNRILQEVQRAVNKRLREKRLRER